VYHLLLFYWLTAFAHGQALGYVMCKSGMHHFSALPRSVACGALEKTRQNLSVFSEKLKTEAKYGNRRWNLCYEPCHFLFIFCLCIPLQPSSHKLLGFGPAQSYALEALILPLLLSILLIIPPYPNTIPDYGFKSSKLMHNSVP
jgi:hypothetical protein